MSTLPYFKDDDFRLLFLDIDDVINSVKTCLAYGAYPHPSVVDRGEGVEGRRFIMGDPTVTDVDAFDHVNVRLIDRLCKATDTHIVLSSSWRMGFTATECRRMLEYIGIDSDRVIGRTTSEWEKDQTRGDEVKYFLDGLRNTDDLIKQHLLVKELAGKSLTPKSYVIIDDSSDMRNEQLDHFVHVPHTEGLRLEDVEKAGQLLVGMKFELADLAK